MKKSCIFICSLFILNLLILCSCEKSIFTLSSTEVQLDIGQFYALSIHKNTGEDLDYTIEWSTNNEKIVTVENGLLKGIGVGSTEIHAKINSAYKDISLTCKVTVNQQTTKAERLSLTGSQSLEVGKTMTLVPLFTPSNIDHQKLTWNSSDEDIATVSDGFVMAVTPGTVTITATMEDQPDITASITINITPSSEKVQALSIPNELTLSVGQAEKIDIKTQPATFKGTITWSSTDTNIVSVINGVATAHKKGTAIIKAEAGGKTAACTVSITDDVHVKLNKTSVSAIDGQTQTIQFSATVTPANLTGKWSISDPYYASVDQNGLVTLKRLPAGEEFDYVKIQVIYTVNSEISAACDIIITRGETTSKIEDIIIDGQNLNLTVGDTRTLTYSTIPADTNVSVIWTSTDPDIVTVDNGKIKAIAPGTARISVSIKDNPDIISRIKIIVT